MFATEARTSAVQDFLAATDDALRVSNFTALGVASAFSRLVREQVYTSEDARNALAEFDVWNDTTVLRLAVEAVDVARADGFIRRFDTKLRPGDALHLAVSARHNCRILTADRGMAAAAALLGIEHLLLGTP